MIHFSTSLFLTEVCKQIFLQLAAPGQNPGVPQNSPATSIHISEKWFLWGGAVLLSSAVYFFLCSHYSWPYSEMGWVQEKS